MKRTSLLKSIFVIVSIWTVLYSCQPRLLEPIPSNNLLTISEAKDFYNSFDLSYSGLSSARIQGKKVKRSANWEQAVQTKFSNGVQAIVVPLQYNDTTKISFFTEQDKKIKKGQASSLTNLLIYKDSKGAMQMVVLNVIADLDYSKNKYIKGKDFSGYVLVTDINETQLLDGWYFKNGKAKSKLSSSSTYQKAGARVADYIIVWISSYVEITEIEAMTLGWGTQWCGTNGNPDVIEINGQYFKEANTYSSWVDTGSTNGSTLPGLNFPPNGGTPYVSDMLSEYGYGTSIPATDEYSRFYGQMIDIISFIDQDETTWLYNQWKVNPQIADDYKVWFQYSRELSSGFTSADMRNWADAQGLTANVQPVRANKRTGLAFEKAAIRYSGTTPNSSNMPSAVRSLFTSQRRTSVRPDGKEGLTVDGSINVEDYLLWEVKCVNGTITLSSNDHQIRGVIDVLKQKQDELRTKMGGVVPPYIKPALYFMTTSDTNISQDIIDEATSKGVRIYQMKAKTLVGNLSNYWIGFGPMRALNFLAEPDSRTGQIIHRIADFIRQYTSDVKLTIPDDPDGYDDDDNDE